MKKNLLVAFAIILTLTFTVMLLTACGKVDPPVDNEIDTSDAVHTVHTYGNWTVTKAPTCAELGRQERTCTECGKKETENLFLKN